jgi:hypothetical protein
LVLREEMEADETQNKVPVTSTKYKRLHTEILLHATQHSEHNTACCMQSFLTYMKLSTSINFPLYRTIITGYKPQITYDTHMQLCATCLSRDVRHTILPSLNSTLQRTSRKRWPNRSKCRALPCLNHEAKDLNF